MGDFNTASGTQALDFNTTGDNNTAIGYLANVSADNLTNATAIGTGATVDANNKIRLGNTAVTVIQGQVAFTASSDKTRKENFQPVDGEEVLGKIRGFELSSWNFIGHDPKEFRHYGPMARDFFAAAVLESKVEDLKSKQAYFETVAAWLEALELQKKHSIQITAEKSLGDKMVDEMP